MLGVARFCALLRETTSRIGTQDCASLPTEAKDKRDKVTPENPQPYWEEGTPLNEAPLRYASDELYARWEQVSAEFTSEDAQKTLGTEPATSSWLETIAHAASSFEEFQAPQNDVKALLEQTLLNGLYHGKFTAFAFEPPRKVASAPFKIPPYFWQGSVSWGNSELRYQGLHFVEVRVVRHDFEPLAILFGEREAGPESIPKPVPERTNALPGRPSIKSLVTDAFQALSAGNRIDCTASALSHYPLIRHWIKTNCADAGSKAENLSNEGIRAYFSPLFKELKKNRKQ